MEEQNKNPNAEPQAQQIGQSVSPGLVETSPTATVQPQSTLPNQNSPLKYNRKWVRLFSIVGALIVLGLIGYFVAKHFDTKKSAPKANVAASSTNKIVSQSSTGTTATGQINTSREEDAESVAAGIALFEGDNNGQVPQSVAIGNSESVLLICSANCTSGNTRSVNLGYYQAKNVVFRPYSSTMLTPNDETMVLVYGAQCGPTAKSLTQEGTPIAHVAIIYDLINGSTPVQQCQTA